MSKTSTFKEVTKNLELIEQINALYDLSFSSVDEIIKYAHEHMPNAHIETTDDLRAFIKFQTEYKKIHTIEELLDLYFSEHPNYKKLHHVDLSELDLRGYESMFVGQLNEYTSTKEAVEKHIILSWTDDVIWPAPDKLPKGFNPQKILEKAKHPNEMDTVHNMGAMGKNIGIAIIDQRLYAGHPEYADRIKLNETVGGLWKQNGIDYHPSLVCGCAVGKTTGTAPEADLYFFAADIHEKTETGKIELSRKYPIIALKHILELNKTLPENKKIRFISCSWGSTTDLHEQECRKLFDECEQNGIMILGGAYKHNNFGSCNKSYPIRTTKIGIPTDGKTTPFWHGGYYYTRQGGSSSTFPYVAGVFACACQDNQIFFTRPNWQNELAQILQDTAIESKNGGKMINPTGIRERVTQIAREMEMNLIKQKSLENE